MAQTVWLLGGLAMVLPGNCSVICIKKLRSLIIARAALDADRQSLFSLQNDKEFKRAARRR